MPKNHSPCIFPTQRWGFQEKSLAKSAKLGFGRLYSRFTVDFPSPLMVWFLPSWLGGHCIPLEHWHWTLIKSQLLFRQLRKVGKFQLLDNITNIIVRESHFLSFNCFGCSVLSILRESHSFLGDPHFLNPHLVRPVLFR